MGYYLKIKDLLDNQAIVVGKTEEWIASLEGLDSSIGFYAIEDDAFKGKAADSSREYLSEVHQVVISSFNQMLTEMRARFLDYVSGYISNIESSETGRIRQESLESELEIIETESVEFDSIDANIRNIISSVSHIVSIPYPKGENIRDSYLNMRTFLTGLNEQIIAYEESHISDYAGVRDILEQINTIVDMHRWMKSDEDEISLLLNRVEASRIYMEQCADVTDEQYKSFCYVREVNRRKEVGVQGTISGVFAVGIGITAIALTWGAATPIVAPEIAVAIGSIATTYGISETYTGIETAYYGYTGEAESVIFNPARDTYFKGHEDIYYGVGEISVLGSTVIVTGGSAVSASVKYGTPIWYEAGKEVTAITAGAGADYFTQKGVSKFTSDPIAIHGSGLITGIIAAGGVNALGNQLRPNFVIPKPNEIGKVAGVEKVIETDIPEPLEGGNEGGKGSNEFFIDDWTGYPEELPKPEGPFRILEGEEYNTARNLANKTNANIHKSRPDLKGTQIHEMHPVKFGGSPTDIDNKIALSPKEHARYTAYWNRALRNMKNGGN